MSIRMPHMQRKVGEIYREHKLLLYVPIGSRGAVMPGGSGGRSGIPMSPFCAGKEMKFEVHRLIELIAALYRG